MLILALYPNLLNVSLCKKKKNRVTSSVLLNVAFVCNFAYLNYIMNFLKVNVRDLAKAKYEDTYLLTTFKFYHVF